MPNHILLRGLWFAAGRMVLFLALFAVQRTDAQWQLVYLPLLAWRVLGRRRLHRLVAAAPAGTAGLLKRWAVHP